MAVLVLPCAVDKQRVLGQEAATEEMCRMQLKDFPAMETKLKLQLLSLLVPLLEVMGFLRNLLIQKWSFILILRNPFGIYFNGLD